MVRNVYDISFFFLYYITRHVTIPILDYGTYIAYGKSAVPFGGIEAIFLSLSLLLVMNSPFYILRLVSSFWEFFFWLKFGLGSSFYFAPYAFLLFFPFGFGFDLFSFSVRFVWFCFSVLFCFFFSHYMSESTGPTTPNSLWGGVESPIPLRLALGEHLASPACPPSSFYLV